MDQKKFRVRFSEREKGEVKESSAGVKDKSGVEKRGRILGIGLKMYDHVYIQCPQTCKATPFYMFINFICIGALALIFWFFFAFHFFNRDGLWLTCHSTSASSLECKQRAFGPHSSAAIYPAFCQVSLCKRSQQTNKQLASAACT